MTNSVSSEFETDSGTATSTVLMTEDEVRLLGTSESTVSVDPPAVLGVALSTTWRRLDIGVDVGSSVSFSWDTCAESNHESPVTMEIHVNGHPWLAASSNPNVEGPCAGSRTHTFNSDSRVTLILVTQALAKVPTAGTGSEVVTGTLSAELLP